jgi:hypothetical protein
MDITQQATQQTTQEATKLASSTGTTDMDVVVSEVDIPQIDVIDVTNESGRVSKGKVTPEELLEALHAAGFSAKESAPQVKRKFPDTTAAHMGKMIVVEYSNPPISKEDTQVALTACEYSQSDIESVISQLFPSPSYVAYLQKDGFLAAASNNAYNFSTGDFTLEAWIKPTGAGTIIGRKGGSGGRGNGGFLFVLRSDSTFKLATDNGFGFYEVDSANTSVFDGNWHYVAGVRTNGALQLYFDGYLLLASIRNNAATPLDVNNGLRLLIGSVDQYQEPFIHYSGLIGEVRIWNISRSRSDIRGHMGSKLQGNENGLVGYWNFENGNGTDLSIVHNTMNPQGNVTYVEGSPFGK